MGSFILCMFVLLCLVGFVGIVLTCVETLAGADMAEWAFHVGIVVCRKSIDPSMLARLSGERGRIATIEYVRFEDGKIGVRACVPLSAFFCEKPMPMVGTLERSGSEVVLIERITAGQTLLACGFVLMLGLQSVMLVTSQDWPMLGWIFFGLVFATVATYHAVSAGRRRLEGGLEQVLATPPH